MNGSACGSAREFNPGAYSTKEDAAEALAAIQPVDRTATAAAAIDLAQETCRRVASPPAKQIVLLSDQQAINWPAQSLAAEIEKLPGPVQVVQVAAQEVENTWVSDFRIQDGIADLATPAVFLATIRFEGSAPRRDVEVTLAVDGVALATQTVELQPGQAREVRLPPYRFDVPVEPGRATFACAEVSIGPHDRLPADDRRVLAVPVVSAMPVVFIDELGSDEDPKRNRFGETFRLRRLLAPVTTREGLEDYEYLWMLRREVAAMEAAPQGGANAPFLARAEEVLKRAEGVGGDFRPDDEGDYRFWDYLSDPVAILALRHDVGEILEALARRAPAQVRTRTASEN